MLAWSAGLQEPLRHSVAEGVRGDRISQPAGRGPALDHQPQPLPAQMSPSGIEEQSRHIRSARQLRPSLIQVLTQRLDRPVKRQGLVVLAIGLSPEDKPSAQVDIFHAERNRLGGAHAGGGKKRQNSGIPQASRGVLARRRSQEGLDLLGAKHTRGMPGGRRRPQGGDQ